MSNPFENFIDKLPTVTFQDGVSYIVTSGFMRSDLGTAPGDLEEMLECLRMESISFTVGLVGDGDESGDDNAKGET